LLLQYHFNWTSSPITGVHKFLKNQKPP